MLVLVTRPREQGEKTARLLATMGHEAIVEPVLEIRPLPVPKLDLAGIAAVAITSANAAHALAALPEDLPVFAVGGATAAAARAAGDRAIRVARGDGRALAALIAQALPPESGAILHLSGAEVGEGLAEDLAAAGFACRRAVVYEAVPTRGPMSETEAALRDGRLGAILFYSPRTARLWAEAATRTGLAGRLRPVVAVCLSEAVAVPLRTLPFREIRVAAAPDQAVLLGCLEAPQ
ncbi:uroporphyrinogen-III synthase [Benzoatithermus flavus]|uniref:Uroporphyrinogen-III synthase n=1 Tax=Benzoatithermus flavus TaxID=3108223 RepID=A0ABU8XRG9_9PROT